MDEITFEIVEQIAQVRKGGRTNMMDRVGVQYIAFDMDLHSLVIWLEDNKRFYFKLLEKLGEHVVQKR